VSAHHEALQAGHRLVSLEGDTVTRRLTVRVSGGHLKLDFIPRRGEAMVSNIAIKPQAARVAR
jgi:hypothetical protein